MSERLTATALHALLVSLLAGATGTGEAKWRKAITAVEIHPIINRGRIACNWSVEAKGSPADLDAIAKAVEVVRVEHPYVSAG
jgi:hypothetical protein